MAKYNGTLTVAMHVRIMSQRMMQVVTLYNRMRGYQVDFIRRAAEAFPDGTEVIYRTGTQSSQKHVGTVVWRKPQTLEELEGLTVVTDGEEYRIPWHRIEGPAAPMPSA